MKVKEAMHKGVDWVDPDTPVIDLAKLMRQHDIGAIPIGENDRLIGMVTDRDIVVRAISEGAGVDSPVSAAMTADPFTVKPDDFAFEAVRLMGEKQVRRVPVVNDDGSLAGIIAMADIALEMEDEREIAETIEEISSGPGFWGKE